MASADVDVLVLGDCNPDLVRSGACGALSHRAVGGVAAQLRLEEALAA